MAGMEEEISVEELKQKMDGKEDFVLLDVREEDEHAQAHIEGSVLVPLSQLPSKIEELKKYGYDSMDHLYNWRWYKKYSAGPIADLGSHQIDIFSWFLGSDPVSVVAVGGSDFYADRDWYEDVLCIYEYTHKHQDKTGTARAFYQVLNTNGFLDYYEKYGGTKGTIMLSENPKQCLFSPERGQPAPDWMSRGVPYHERMAEKIPHAPSYREAVEAGLIEKSGEPKKTRQPVGSPAEASSSVGAGGVR